MNSLKSHNKHKYRNGNYWSVFTIIFFFLQSFIPVFAQNKLSQLVQKSKSSVFSIVTYDSSRNPLAYGTGFFIDSKGTGITNYHVLEGASSAQIKTLDGNHYSINNIISQSKKMDIIKFSIDNETNRIFPFLSLCQLQPLEAEDVFVIGNPKELEYSVSNGIISSIRTEDGLGKIIQTTAPISSGNSGSPLMNMKGEVLGVISFTLLEGQNLNFAISVYNFAKMELVNQYLFPPPDKNSIIVTDNIFKKFEWKTSSAEILQKETKTFFEKGRNPFDDDLTVKYRGIIASIDVEVRYHFDLDELRSIGIQPIRPSPSSPNYMDFVYGDKLKVIINEYLTLKKALIKVLGNDFGECEYGSKGLYIDYCSNESNFEKDKSKFLISNDATITYLNLSKLKNELGGKKKVAVVNTWRIPSSNSKYELEIDNWCPLSPENWNLYLRISPIGK